MADLNLRILISAQNAASAVLRSVESDISHMNPAMGAVAGIALAAGAALVGTGVAATSMAANFQQAMLSNVAHAGLAKDQYNAVSDAVLNMAGQVGQMPTALAQALYPILSGFSGITDQAAKTKVSLTELQLAAESVAGTTANVTDVSRAATAAFNAYGMASNNTATNIAHMNSLFDIMNQTVTEGNMQWNAYASKIGDLAAKASQSGIKFTEANAALAVFTNTGESVQLAGTHLGALFQSMALDVDKYVTRAAKLHESFDATKFKSMDLAGKLKYLEDITGGDSGKIKAILGNKTLASTYLKLIDHTKDYQNALKDLNNAHGATKTAFDTASQGFNQAMSRAKASIDVVMIKIGTALLPVLTDLTNAVVPIITKFGDWLVKSGVLQGAANALKTAIGFLAGTITNLVSWGSALANFFQKNELAMDALKAVLLSAAVIIGVNMVGAMGAWAVSMIPVIAEALTLAAPFLIVGAIIAGIIFGIILVVQKWGAIMDWFGNKAEQTRIKVELEHTKMAIAADEKTAEGAQKAIANEEKKRQGILAKLRSCHNEAERQELLHQLKMVDAQIKGNQAKLQKAEEDKKAQLAKQKELHDQLLEAQKNWLQRSLDTIGGWAQSVWGKITNIFGGIGGWFHDRWMSIVKSFQDDLGQIGNIAQGIWNNIIGGIKSVINGFIGIINGMINGVNNITGKIGIPAIPDIPLLYTGGQVGPGAFIAGDRGPELVVTGGGARVYNRDTTSAMMGGRGAGGSGQISRGHTFNITINGMISRNKQEMMDFIIQELTRQLHGSGKLGTITSGGRL